MKIIRALYYQYYWWHMRQEGNEFFAPLLAGFCVLLPFFGVIGFLMILADATGLIALQKYDMKMSFYSAFILGLVILWWLFLRKKQYKTIVREHNIYGDPRYRTLAVIYPVLSVILFWIGLYIGYAHNVSNVDI